MSEHKAEIERRIENLEHTLKVVETRFDKRTLKVYQAKIELLESILETVANGDNKDQDKALRLPEVSGCALEFDITKLSYTVENDHGILEVKIPYQYNKIKQWKTGDKVLIQHCR